MDHPAVGEAAVAVVGEELPLARSCFVIDDDFGAVVTQ